MDPSLRELFPDFLQEAYDTLAKVQDTLKGFAGLPDKDKAFEEIFRGVHTVKGGSGMFELSGVKEIAHKLETALAGFRGKMDALKPEKIVAIQKTVDRIEDLLRKAEQEVLGGAVPAVAEAPAEPAAGPSAPAPEAAASPAAAAPSSGASTDVLRVPLPHVTNALNNIWEVFLIRNQLAYLFEQERPYLKGRIDFLQSWEMLDSALKRNIAELEGTLMAMRMNSVKGLFSRMEKIVRSYLEASPGKEISFSTAGEATELDKKVLDMLGEPLVHLVRNAMDHGIETRESRLAAGKPAQGRIVLSAEAMADRVLVRIQDDGKGIDGAKLLEKAEAKGLDVTPFKTGRASPVEIIFLPGFSTAEKVTDVSGRGVGMDAVRQSIAALGGSVEIETSPGRGTVFSINLPLSLSVIPATVFRVNEETFGSNVGSIVEICRVPAEEVKSSNGAQHFYFRGRYIPVFDLREYLAGGAPGSASASLFVFRHKLELLALRASEVIENMDVVVKPLPSLLPKLPFVQGMSILPTGKAIFILSFEAFLEEVRAGRLPKLPHREENDHVAA